MRGGPASGASGAVCMPVYPKLHFAKPYQVYIFKRIYIYFVHQLKCIKTQIHLASLSTVCLGHIASRGLLEMLLKHGVKHGVKHGQHDHVPLHQPAYFQGCFLRMRDSLSSRAQENVKTFVSVDSNLLTCTECFSGHVGLSWPRAGLGPGPGAH